MDGSQHKAPCGGDGTGPNPTDRAKSGWKWSIATEAAGVPVGWAADGANRHDIRLLAPTLDAVGHRGLDLDIDMEGPWFARRGSSARPVPWPVGRLWQGMLVGTVQEEGVVGVSLEHATLRAAWLTLRSHRLLCLSRVGPAPDVGKARDG